MWWRWSAWARCWMRFNEKPQLTVAIGKSYVDMMVISFYLLLTCWMNHPRGRF
jgi:hypothetical protein